MNLYMLMINSNRDKTNGKLEMIIKIPQLEQIDLHEKSSKILKARHVGAGL